MRSVTEKNVDAIVIAYFIGAAYIQQSILLCSAAVGIRASIIRALALSACDIATKTDNPLPLNARVNNAI